MLSKLNILVFDKHQRLLFGTVTVAAAAAAAAAYIARSVWYSRRLPPGPAGVPFLGRLPWIDVDHIEESQEEMRQRYGDIYSYRAGQRLMIVVGSYELLNDMLRRDVFSGRQSPPFRVKVTEGCGLAFTEGQTWIQQRRICLRILRSFGFSRPESASIVTDEVDRILTSIESRQKGWNTAELFSVMSNSIIARMVFGRSYASEDARYEKFIRDIEDIANLGVGCALGFLFPTFSNLLEQATAATSDYLKAFKSLRRFVEEEIAERECQLADSDNCEAGCLIDAFIQERRRAEAADDSVTHRPFHMVVTSMEMFVAGTETTAKSLQWLMLHMAVYTDAQARVQREIDNIVGRERRPQMNDKIELHFTQAVIDESMRLASLDYNGLPHRAVKDVTFRGFSIPADAAVVPFVFGVHRDPSNWRRPNEFYPEHFLDENGHYRSSKSLIPFLVGKRACPGESLSRLEIFLTFAAVMQRFRVALSQEDQSRVDEILRGSTRTLRTAGHHLIDFCQR